MRQRRAHDTTISESLFLKSRVSSNCDALSGV